MALSVTVGVVSGHSGTGARRAAAHGPGMEHGTLFSHASETATDDLVTGHPTRAAAVARSLRVCGAQPGIEVELMTREPGGTWRSQAGLTAREVIAMRWA